MVDLSLSPEDQALLDGARGPAAARAMRLLVRYGRALGADRFIPIVSAHIDGCLFHGEASLDFARAFVEDGGRVAVPTTLNVAAVDLQHAELYPGKRELIDDQAELIRLHEALGCTPTLTCAPYQRLIRPRFGEHVAWAESNAIVFVNSVLGARTDRYGDFTDLCAAIAGRVPYAGLHRDENRRAMLRIDVPTLERSGLPRDLYFAAIGYRLGELARGRVAVLTGLPLESQEHELKMLGAASATSGSVALFHAAGVTPEATTVEAAAGGNANTLEAEVVSAADLANVLHRTLSDSTGRAHRRRMPGHATLFVERIRGARERCPGSHPPFRRRILRFHLARYRRGGRGRPRDAAAARFRRAVGHGHLHLHRAGGARERRRHPDHLGEVGPLCAGQYRTARGPDLAGALRALRRTRADGGGMSATNLTLAPGMAHGRVARLSAPLSLWGGFSSETGRIVDANHPEHGLELAGRILVMDGGRGSSSASSTLAEAARRGTAPAAILLTRPDPILVIGSLVAADLYGREIPIVLVADRDWSRLIDGVEVEVNAGQDEAALIF